MKRFKEGDRVITTRQISFGLSNNKHLPKNYTCSISMVHPEHSNFFRINDLTWWFDSCDFKLVTNDFISYSPKNTPKE